jgi:hypothetical protein
VHNSPHTLGPLQRGQRWGPHVRHLVHEPWSARTLMSLGWTCIQVCLLLWILWKSKLHVSRNSRFPGVWRDHRMNLLNNLILQMSHYIILEWTFWRKKRYSARPRFESWSRDWLFSLYAYLCKQMGKCLKETCTRVKEIVKTSCAWTGRESSLWAYVYMFL